MLVENVNYLLVFSIVCLLECIQSTPETLFKKMVKLYKILFYSIAKVVVFSSKREFVFHGLTESTLFCCSIYFCLYFFHFSLHISVLLLFFSLYK